MPILATPKCFICNELREWFTIVMESLDLLYLVDFGTKSGLLSVVQQQDKSDRRHSMSESECIILRATPKT